MAALYLCRMALALSPTIMSLVSMLEPSSSTIALMYLTTDEWIPPQRPRSEDIATTKWLGFALSCAISAFSKKANQRTKRIIITITYTTIVNFENKTFV